MSDRRYYQEFLYDKTGALIFYFLKAEEDENQKRHESTSQQAKQSVSSKTTRNETSQPLKI
jgi:hypothetical protein